MRLCMQSCIMCIVIYSVLFLYGVSTSYVVWRAYILLELTWMGQVSCTHAWCVDHWVAHLHQHAWLAHPHRAMQCYGARPHRTRHARGSLFPVILMCLCADGLSPVSMLAQRDVHQCAAVGPSTRWRRPWLALLRSGEAGLVRPRPWVL